MRTGTRRRQTAAPPLAPVLRRTRVPSKGRQTTRPPLLVLYLDGSSVFGDPTRSMRLLWKAVPGLSPILFTAQEAGAVRARCPEAEVHRLHRFANGRQRPGEGPAGRVVRTGAAVLQRGEGAWNELRLRRLIRQRSVDLLHLNDGVAPPEAIRAASALGVPCIVHARGYPSAPVTGALRKWGSPARWIAVSHSVARALQREGVPESRISVIHDPVDLGAFTRARRSRSAVRARLGIAPDEVAVGLFASALPGKGQFEFVQAMLRAMQRDPRLRGVLVDEGAGVDREYRDRVVQAVRSSERADRFIFSDHRRDREGHYCAMDIVAHTSVDPEPFGRAIVEGMAAKRPVVASAAGSPPELVIDEVDGLLRSPRHPEELADAYVRLARDPVWRSAMGEAGYRAARGSFSLDRIGMEVRDLYDQVLSGRQKS